jgi:sporulation protein YlmC with PRC-barrel domain
MTVEFQRTKLGLGIAALSLGLMAPMAAQAAAHTAGARTPATTEKTANPARDPIDIRRWDMAPLRGGYSAERLLDTTVRGENGKDLGEVENFLVNKEGRITGIIVESQGFLDIGDTHFFVPWKQVKLGHKLTYVQVPVNERTLPDFSLFSNDESIYKPGDVYRGNELLGEFIRLKDGVPYGYVDDIVFSSNGQIQAIVARPDRRYGYGAYAYPYYGMSRGLGYYNMPYGRTDISGLRPFDYSALGIATPAGKTARTGT